MARMVMAAATNGSLREVLIIASALGAQDPRERPADKQQQSDEAHRRFQNPESDFLALVALWWAGLAAAADGLSSSRRSSVSKASRT